MNFFSKNENDPRKTELLKSSDFPVDFVIFKTNLHTLNNFGSHDPKLAELFDHFARLVLRNL